MAIDLRDNIAGPSSRVTVAALSKLGLRVLAGGASWAVVIRSSVGRRVVMYKNLNTDPNKRPRLLGQLGDLAHTKVSSSEFKYVKNSEIFGQEEPADYIYQVVEGAVRSHKLLTDDRRQIGAFHLPGDIFGLVNGKVHRFTAEAIVATTVRLINRQSLDREAKTDAA